MPEPDGYKDWTGLAQAIKAAATKAAGDGASALDVNAQIVQAQPGSMVKPPWQSKL